MVGHRNLSVHSIMSYSFTLLDIIIIIMIRSKQRDQFGANVIELDSVDFQNQSGTMSP